MLSGMINIEIAPQDAQNFSQYNQGGLVELQLVGIEKTWFANGFQHDPKRVGSFRQQVGGADRREQFNILIDQKMQIPIKQM